MTWNALDLHTDSSTLHELYYILSNRLLKALGLTPLVTCLTSLTFASIGPDLFDTEVVTSGFCHVQEFVNAQVMIPGELGAALSSSSQFLVLL